MPDLVEGPKIAALSCGKPVYLVLLLHGEGGEAQDMLDLSLGWAPEMIKADFLAVETGLRDSAGRSLWFSSPQERDRMTVEFNAFIDERIAASRLPASHLALVGFGQGASLAVAAGLARRDRLAALVGFSGIYDMEALPVSETSPPTLLIHGDNDDRAPFSGMVTLKEAMKARGAPVWSFRRPGLGHVLDADGVDAAGAFLARHVKHVKPEPA